MTKKWVAIQYFKYIHEAYMAKNLLESSGIETLFRDELTTQVHQYAHASGGIGLMVQRDRAIRAIDLLKKGGYMFDRDQNKKDEIKLVEVSSSQEMEHCPFCSSENIRKFKSPNMLTVVAALLLRVIFPFSNKYYQCFDCDEKWQFKLKKLKV